LQIHLASLLVVLLQAGCCLLLPAWQPAVHAAVAALDILNT